MEASAQSQPRARGGYRFDSFEAMEEALLNLIRWPEEGESGREWKIRCRKVESGADSKHGRFICLTGVGGDTRYYIYEKLPLEKQEPRKQLYSWEHFRDASVLLELLVTESATIFGGSMKLIMKWLSDHAESIIEDTRFRS
ncbi:MAG: hypothetical protein U5R46_16490 [Gammaproteobacteria bacterium]|nr:hypothetical protein [Gammaproteobacteria bacterium]